MTTISDIKNRIIEVLKLDGKTEYFTVYSVKGERIRIRVGNHSGNSMNNGDTKTLSFVTERTQQRKSAYNRMVGEWEVDLESELTDTSQTIEQVLDWEDVSDNQQEAEELYIENCL